ncbi:MAG TPA: heme ABC exporter ATP-binding protein CcmA [Devosia sp.]|nr:heme ABC exporter ATP-binding protein CcmA [Devosia sp.]
MTLASADTGTLGMAAMSPGTPLLTVRDLALSRGGRRLFSGLGFVLAPGTLLLLRGPNGAGKSSLLLTLAGILRPDAGALDWGGEPPALHLLAHAAGAKARLTLEENLAFWRKVNGPTGLTPAEALRIVGLGGLDRLDAGYLSAGQTRRLALARLLVTDRKLWLLDEPTAALDAEGDAIAAALIAARLGSGGAVIAATHHDLPGATATLTLGDSQ